MDTAFLDWALADFAGYVAVKVYVGFSSRRFMSDLREAQKQEHIHKAAHFNSVSRYLANPALTDTFSQLVTLSSLPLKGIENNFAVDSSGFSTCRFVRWFHKKYGREVDNREWVKLHLMCGVDTKIVTSFSMLKGKFGDSVRSKSDIGQINEALCKVLCHNLCVLIQAIHELGIEPTFDAKPPSPFPPRQTGERLR